MIMVKRGSPDRPQEQHPQNGPVLAVHGPVIQRMLDNKECAVKICREGEDYKTIVSLAHRIQKGGALNWAEGASKNNNINVIISNWIQGTPQVKMQVA